MLKNGMTGILRYSFYTAAAVLLVQFRLEHDAHLPEKGLQNLGTGMISSEQHSMYSPAELPPELMIEKAVDHEKIEQDSHSRELTPHRSVDNPLPDCRPLGGAPVGNIDGPPAVGCGAHRAMEWPALHSTHRVKRMEH